MKTITTADIWLNYCLRRKYKNTKRVWITHNGKTLTISDWARELGVSRQTLWMRYSSQRSQLPMEKVFQKGNFCEGNVCSGRKTSFRTYNGETLSIREWAEKLGVNKDVLWNRLRKYPLDVVLSDSIPKREKIREISWNGKTQSVEKWAEEIGIEEVSLRNRLKRMSLEKALQPPGRRITYRGKTQRLNEWAKEIGIRPMTLWFRLRKMSVEEALTTPLKKRIS